VNALVNKSRPVNFRVHIGDYCFVSMKDDWDYVQIFERLPEPLKIFAKDMCPACSYDPYHEGISMYQRLETTLRIYTNYPRRISGSGKRSTNTEVGSITIVN